jgi:hypothetical protein
MLKTHLLIETDSTYFQLSTIEKKEIKRARSAPLLASTVEKEDRALHPYGQNLLFVYVLLIWSCSTYLIILEAAESR